MNSVPATPRTVILAAIEPSEASVQVIRTASNLARMLPGTELHLLHVVDPGPPPHDLALSLTDLMHEGRKFLESAVREASEASERNIVAHLAVGKPAERILQIASDLSTDLVVVGTHGKRFLSRALGSVSATILADAGCAVLVARPKAERSDIPSIEPPCPACVETQKATQGETLWCKAHSQRHVHGRLHYSAGAGFGGGSMFLRS